MNFFYFQLMSKMREKHPQQILDSHESDEEEDNGEDKHPSTSPDLSTGSGDKDISCHQEKE